MGMAEGDLHALGYVFCPSDEMLVNKYLRARIAGKIHGHAASDCFAIIDADVCSAPPYELAEKHAPMTESDTCSADGKVWYFFSPVRFAGSTKKMRLRTVDGTDGKECWHPEGKDKPVKGSAGGYLKKFSYHVKIAPGVVEKPGWLMVEYGISGAACAGDIVLCKIYKSPRGPGRSISSSSSASSGKRKAADSGELLQAAPPNARARLQTDDDDMPEPQFAPAPGGVLGNKEEQVVLLLDGIETLLMADDDDDAMAAVQVPEGEDPEEFYARLLFQGGEQQLGAVPLVAYTAGGPGTDAVVQTVHGPLTNEQLMAALAAGVTVGDLFGDA
ncbi:hypothetical protein ACP4OV_029471 [Aristida adscensionis]